MKILIINQHISDLLGGSEMQCDLIASGLAKRGHNVIYGAVNPKKDNYRGFGYKIIPLNIGNKEELFDLVRREKPDIVYWRFNKKHFYKSAKIIKKAGVPLVFAVSHINDTIKYSHKNILSFLWFLRKPKLIKKVLKDSLISRYDYNGFKYVDGIAFQLNNQVKRNLIKNKKYAVIKNSVLTKKDDFQWDKEYCLWVANIKASKQPEKYIELVKSLMKSYPRIDFLMIGNIQNESYKGIIEKANRDLSNFHYLGGKTLEEVNGALEKALCLIHTCKPEGFPNNLIQAWAQGCPTVSLEYDPDNLIEKEKLGFVSGSVEKMAEDLSSIIENNDLREEMGERVKKFASSSFGPDRMVDEIESFLDKIIRISKK